VRIYFEETYERTFIDIPAGGALEVETRGGDDGTDPLVLVWTGKPYAGPDGRMRLEPFPDQHLGVCYAPKRLSSLPPADSPSTLTLMSGYCSMTGPAPQSRA
jgi:hypothetical protein